MPKIFGRKVRELRESKQITREEFCGDEAELSIRQLARIEGGQCVPSLVKMQYIASRLEVSLSDLTGEIQELPKRYKEIKYALLRISVYQDEEKIRKQEEYFNEIAENFYENLPESEQLTIDCLQAAADIYHTHTLDFGKGLLEDYFSQVKHKYQYETNDILLIRIYMLCYSSEFFDIENTLTDDLLDRMLNGLEHYDTETLFLVNALLTSFFAIYLIRKDQKRMEQILQMTKELTEEIHDFHRIPTNYLMEWKYCLFYKNDQKQAEACYQKGLQFAQVMEDDYLENQLKVEWEKDQRN